MYRVRVDAVSGLKVLAGGKWLTCIGNRAVRAGDFVWTDGRCIYGNDSEAETPMVIVVPKKDEDPLPLCLPARWSSTSPISFSLYDLRKNSIGNEHIRQGTEFPESVDPFWGVRNEADYLMTNTTKLVVFSNAMAIGRTQLYLDYKDVIGRVALNVDNDGNVYEVRCESIRTGLTSTGDHRVQIIKNNSVVQTFNIIEHEFNEEFTRPTSPVNIWHSFFSGTGYRSSFIENENNWWIIFSDITDFYANASGEFWQVTMTMIDNHGKHRLFTRTAQTLTVDLNIKIPMQDGFYFKINGDIKVEYPADEGYFTDDAYILYSLKTEVPVTIYSPQDIPLMDTKIRSASHDAYIGRFYFTGCQITPNKFLIGSRQEGIYLCHDRSIRQIFKGRIANQCLRPMKKCRRWWEKIQSIDEGGEESE